MATDEYGSRAPAIQARTTIQCFTPNPNNDKTPPPPQELVVTWQWNDNYNPYGPNAWLYPGRSAYAPFGGTSTGFCDGFPHTVWSNSMTFPRPAQATVTATVNTPTGDYARTAHFSVFCVGSALQ